MSETQRPAPKTTNELGVEFTLKLQNPLPRRLKFYVNAIINFKIGP